MKYALALAGAFALTAVGLATSACAQDATAAITAAVADPMRPAADTARDAERKPADVVEFAGVKPGDTVVELMPGGGYYTRILAKTVGPSGHVYSLVPTFFASRPGAMDKLNDLAKQYGNVTMVTADLDNFTVPKPADVVWTTENYHDFHNGPNANIAGLDKSAFNALKPGGIFYVEDHAAAPGAGTTVTSTLHRIDKAAAISEIEKAGFKLDAQSDLLANPADTHEKKVFDPAIRGHTDKFMLRFKKPG